MVRYLRTGFCQTATDALQYYGHRATLLQHEIFRDGFHIRTLTILSVILLAASVAMALIIRKLKKDDEDLKAYLSEVKQRGDSVKNDNLRISDVIQQDRLEIKLWKRTKEKIKANSTHFKTLAVAGLLVMMTSCMQKTSIDMFYTEDAILAGVLSEGMKEEASRHEGLAFRTHRASDTRTEARCIKAALPAMPDAMIILGDDTEDMDAALEKAMKKHIFVVAVTERGCSMKCDAHFIVDGSYDSMDARECGHRAITTALSMINGLEYDDYVTSAIDCSITDGPECSSMIEKCGCLQKDHDRIRSGLAILRGLIYSLILAMLTLMGMLISKAVYLSGLLGETLNYTVEIHRIEKTNERLKWEREKVKAQKVRVDSETDAFIDMITRKEIEEEENSSEFKKKVMMIMNGHISDTSFNIDKLVKELGMSRSNFFIKWKKETGLTANNVMQNIRLKAAWDMLINGKENVSEICFKLGFNSLSYFSRCFKAKYGISPRDVRN